jgi:hypothetical protein
MLSSGIWNLLTYNKSLDASGGSVFLNLLGAARGALNRAAASTQPFAVRHSEDELVRKLTF